MKTRKLTVTDIHRGKSLIVPELRLRGKWLKAAGFGRGTQVELHIDGDKITITKLT